MSVTRRDFATHLTAAISGAVAVSLAGSASAADPMPKPVEPPVDESAPPAPSIEDHQLAVLKELHPAPHLTAEMEEGIREGLKHNRAVSDRIRQVPLAYDVPPAVSFHVPPAR